MVHTSTYQYILVQHGTGQYENSSFVQDSMYQYIPVQAFNKTCGFPTNPGSDVAAHSGPIEEHWNSLLLDSERWPVAVQLTL